MATPTVHGGWSARAVVAAIAMGAALAAQAAPDVCGLLTDSEAAQLVARGQPTFQEPEALATGGGFICQYEHGQTGLWVGSGSGTRFEQFLKSWRQDKQPRLPVAGVGDSAYVLYPEARNDYSDQGPMVVATVGEHTVTAALFAREGAADGLMGEVCRGNQSQLNEKEKKECAGILADRGETPQSLQPAAVELARILVARVRAGAPGLP